MQNFDYNDPLSAQAESAKANLLRARQAQEYRAPQGPGMVGRVYVGAHPLQGLAEVLRTQKAANQEDIYSQELKDIGAQRQKALVEGLRTFNDTFTGKSAVAPQRTEAAIPAFDEADAQAQQANVGGYSGMTGGQAEVKGNPLAAITGLSNSANPMLAQAGIGMLAQYPQQQAEAKAKAAQIERQEKADAERERHNKVMEANTIAAINARNSGGGTSQSVPKGKTLTSGEVDKITSLDESLGTQKRLMETFKPEYAGYGSNLLGGAANAVGSRFSDKLQPQSEWWAAHEANDNIMRNKLFGASLTAGEQAAWDRTSIKPGMSPEMVKNRMAERAALIEAQRNTRLGNLGKAGYDVSNFGAAPDTFKSTPTPEKPAASGATPMFASNGAQRIVSNDGGKTWQPVK